MSPQPMGPVFKEIHLCASASVLEQRPKLAILVAQIISQWSVVEMYVGNVFACLIGANNDSAMIMYDSLRTAGAKHSTMQSLARHRIHPEDMKLFQAVLNAIKPVEVKRNAFARCTINSRDDLPDGIILVDPRHVARAVYARMLHSTLPPSFQNVSDELKRKSLIYREADLRLILKEIEEAQELAFYLAGLFLSGDHLPDARSRLQSSARVAKELSRGSAA